MSSVHFGSPFHHRPPRPNQSYPPDEHIYNTLAPKQGNDDSGAAEGQTLSENLPSSPPPPPYESPSPSHQASMSLKQGHLEHDVDNPTGIQELGQAGHHTQSLSSHGTPSASTPPTPQSGNGSRSTLTSHSPRSLSSVNRSPRYTRSFSGGSPMQSAGSSPHTPIRTLSMRSGQYSPAKPSPPLVPRRNKDHGKQVAKSDGIFPLQTQQLSMQKTSDVLDDLVTPINIDPSALQKEGLTINPNNFLNDSPAYDRLGKGRFMAHIRTCIMYYMYVIYICVYMYMCIVLHQGGEGEKVVSVLLLSKKPSSGPSGTHYNLETVCYPFDTIWFLYMYV